MKQREYRDVLSAMPARELAFDEAEYRRRSDRVRAAMETAGLDVLLVTEPASICYLSGYTTFEVSPHACLVFPGRGEPALQVASIEVAPAVYTTWVEEVIGYAWEREEEIGRQLADCLRLRGLSRGAIGVEERAPGLRPSLRDEIAGALPEAGLVEASRLVRGVRAVKSEPEIACLRRAASFTRAGIEAAIGAVAEGARDNDVAAEAYAALVRAGSEFPSMPAIVTSGHRGGWVHTCFRRIPIERGDAVFVELGGAYHRYTAPMMRTAHVGPPPAQVERVAAAVEDTVSRLIEAVRPGRSCHETALEAERGLAPVADEVFFSGVYGYSVGIQFPPSWVEGDLFLAEGLERELEPGMVFHLPICYRVPGRFAVGLSETLAVTDRGCEILTERERGLRIA